MKPSFILIILAVVMLAVAGTLQATPRFITMPAMAGLIQQVADTTDDDDNILKVAAVGKCPGTALRVVTNSVSTYMIGTDHKVYYYDDTARSYIDYGGSAYEIALDANGQVFYIGSDNAIYKRTAANDGWMVHSAKKALKIAFGGYANDADNNDNIKLSCIGTDNKIYNWSAANSTWNPLSSQPSPAVEIALDEDGTIWYVDKNGSVWMYDTPTDRFVKVNGVKAEKISIGDDGTVCVLWSNSVYSYNGSDWVNVYPYGGSGGTINQFAVGNQNSMFYLRTDNTVWETNAGGVGVATNGDVYQIFNLSSNLPMEDSSTVVGTQLYQNTNTGLAKQLWRAKKINDSAYAFINVMSGKAMALETNSSSLGVPIVIKDDISSTDIYQRWLLKDTLSGSVTFRNNGSLLSAEIAGGSKNPLGKIRQFSINSINQVWYLKPRVGSSSAPTGWVDGGGNKVTGWSYDADMPSKSQMIYIYEGNTLVDSLPTDIFRWDIFSIFSVTGAHGFGWTIADRFFDGLPHTFTARAADVISSAPPTLLSGSYTFQYQPCSLNMVTDRSTMQLVSIAADASLFTLDAGIGGTKIVSKWNGTTWNQVGAPTTAISLAADNNGRPWIVDNSYTLYKLLNCAWVPVTGHAVKKVACGPEGTIAVIGTDNIIYEYDETTRNWLEYDHPYGTEDTNYPVDIAVDNAGQIWFIDSGNAIWYWDDTMGDWTNLVSASGTRIRCGIDGSVFWTGTNNSIYKWNGADSGFVIGSLGTASKDFAVYNKSGICKLDGTKIYIGSCFTPNAAETDAPFVSGTPAVCLKNGAAAGSTQLSASVPGGVWTSSNPNIISVNASSGLATATGMGTANILYSATGCYTQASYPISVVSNTTNTANAGNALNFNGGNSYVSVPAGFPITSEVTYEAWIYANSFSQQFMAIMNYDGWLPGYLHMQFQYDKLVFGVNGGTASIGTYSFLPNNWYHIAVTYSVSAHTTKMYVNGQLTDAFTTGNYPAVTANLPLTVGGWQNSRIFNGNIDEIRVWNKALTQSEIKSRMNKELAGNEANLVVYYNFNDGVAGGNNSYNWTLFDRTTNARNGSLTNFALGGGTTANWVAGAAFPSAKNGNNLNFDGVDDYVAVPSNINMPVNNSTYTMEAMIKPNVHATNGIVGYGTWWQNNGVNALRLGTSNAVHNYWWGNDLIATAPGNLADGNWHHVAATFDGTTRKIFIDGALSASDNPTGHIVTNTSNLAIGRTFENEYFNGSLDEVRIWKVARTQAQIQANMSGELSVTDTTGLVAYYNFNQGDAGRNNSGVTTLANAYAVNSGNNGTLNGFALNGSGSNWIADDAGTYTITLSCPYNSFQLNNATSGGVWSSSDNAVATVDANGLVSSTGQGTAYISYTLTNGGGCSNAVVTKVNVTNPPASASFSSVPATTCEGAPVMFVATNICSSNTNAVTFSGSSSGATATLVSTAIDNISIELWAKWDGNATTNRILFYNGNTATSGFGIMISTTGNIQVLVGGKNFVTSSAFLKANLWQHITVVRASGVWTFYLNGVQFGAATNSTLAPNTPAGSTYIGRNQNNLENFGGSIDEVKFWTSARSDAQVQADMSACSASAGGGLLNYWSFNDGVSAVDAISGKNLTFAGNTFTGAAGAGVTGNGFNWNFGDGQTGSLGAVNHIYNTTGTKAAALTVANSSGCTGSASGTVTITSSTIAHIYESGTDWSASSFPPTFSCCNNNYTLTCATAGGVWTSSNPAVATINSSTGVLTTKANGNTTFTYTVSGSSCGSRSLDASVVTFTTHAISPSMEAGREETGNSRLVNVFPNPTHGRFTVKLSAGMENATVLVQSMLGITVASSKSYGLTRDIQLSGKAKGIYLVKVITAKGDMITQKLALQ